MPERQGNIIPRSGTSGGNAGTPWRSGDSFGDTLVSHTTVFSEKEVRGGVPIARPPALTLKKSIRRSLNSGVGRRALEAPVAFFVIRCLRLVDWSTTF